MILPIRLSMYNRFRINTIYVLNYAFLKRIFRMRTIHDIDDKPIPIELIGQEVIKMISNRFILTRAKQLYERSNQSLVKVEIEQVRKLRNLNFRNSSTIKILTCEIKILDVCASKSHIIIATENGVFCRGNSPFGQCGIEGYLDQFLKVNDRVFQSGIFFIFIN